MTRQQFDNNVIIMKLFLTTLKNNNCLVMYIIIIYRNIKVLHYLDPTALFVHIIQARNSIVMILTTNTVL